MTIDRDPNGTALLEALVAAHGPAVAAPPVAAASLPGQGRGLVATASLRAGQTVVAVPFDAVVTPARAARRSSLHSILAARPDPLPDWSLLALWLAEQLHIYNTSGGGTADPATAAYVATLPPATGCVLEWDAAQVAWLEGSQLHALAIEIRGAFEASWAELAAVVAAGEAAGAVPPGALNEAALRRAFSLLLSRTIRLDGAPPGEPSGAPPADTSVPVLCPWADLVNHDSSCTAFLRYDPAARAVQLVSDRALRPGDQAVACYGEKTNGVLLLSYGFAPPEGSNPHDGALLRVALPPGGPAAAVAAARGGAAQRVFPLLMEAAPGGLLEWAAFGAMQFESVEAAEAGYEEVVVGGRLDAAAARAGAAAVAAACKAAAAGYAVGLEAAKAELAAGAEGLRGTVLRVLAQEQRVLARTAFIMRQRAKNG